MKLNVSVAMTTYNGDKYIKEQLDSILSQINLDDEIIICDDGSTDKTITIIKEYMNKDKRIKLYKNNHLGAVLNFESAISKCTKEIIFLSDQDDIWCDKKIFKVMECFANNNTLLVLHNGRNFTGCNRKINDDLIKNMKHGFLRNIIKSCYWGCCMAFRRELIVDKLPFPNNLIAHDQFIGLLAEAKKASIFLDENLILHRIHNNNVTSRLSIKNKIRFRMNLLYSYIKSSLME